MHNRKINQEWIRRLTDYSRAADPERSLRQRRGRRAAGCLVTAGAALSAPSAGAAIVYTDLSPDVTVNSTNIVQLVNIAGQDRFSVYFWSPGTPTKAVSKSISVCGLTSNAQIASAAPRQAAYFANGNAIGAGANWATNTWQMLVYSGTWTTGTRGRAGGNFLGADGYIGIRFPTGSGTDPKYGWIRFEGTSGASGIVKGWAYQDDGSGINAGEPQ